MSKKASSTASGSTRKTTKKSAKKTTRKSAKKAVKAKVAKTSAAKKATRKSPTKKAAQSSTSVSLMGAPSLRPESDPTRPHPKSTLSIRRANLHNLKDISVDLPRNRLIVVTGLSGSGKSTLAFDTIYAEGQRRYVESLSSYARQFLSRMAKPEVESITGLAPAVAIQQQVLQRNPRSTVGTTTEVYDYMRLMFGRIGKTICLRCGSKVKRDTPRTVQQKVAEFDEGTRLYVLFPMPDHENHSLADEIASLRARGFFRLVSRTNTDIIDVTEDDAAKALAKGEKSDYSVLVDRLVWKNDENGLSRIAEAAETGFREGDGEIEVRLVGEVAAKETSHQFNRRFDCSGCGMRYLEPEPRLFSFNNPFGACPECQGFGRAVGVSMDLVIPDRRRTIRQGAIQVFSTPKHKKHLEQLLAVAREANLDTGKPISEFDERERSILMDGFGDYIGIHGFFKMVEKNTYKMHYRVLLARYRGYTTCAKCHGSRLRTSATQVFVGGKRITEINEMTIDDAQAWFLALAPNKHDATIAGRVIDEIRRRLRFLVEVGLGYIRLDRLSHSLSGGEMQRINLATSIGSSLVGAMYVLDEPSIGLHPRDTGRLIKILKELRDLGNTVIVVEHDPEMIEAADIVLEMGPLAGEHGGDIVFIGSVEQMLKDENSTTGAWLSGRERAVLPDKTRVVGKAIELKHATLHNLQDVQVLIPRRALTVVTGVSGSGKSTLIHDVFYRVASYRLGSVNRGEDRNAQVLGLEGISMIEMIDQSPIGRSPRSNPATYTKAFDAIRELFSQTSHARMHGWSPGYFSFNVAGGRCDVCSGEGYITVDMQFLADIQLPCDSCGASRYKSEVLNARYNGKTVVDVLEMTVDEAIEFFSDESRIARRLKPLAEVGLGYIRLGQPATTLSGGEAQRVKLAAHLASPNTDEQLFILDEPTTGLHMKDVSVLMKALHALVDAGHTVIVIEHNLDVIAAADWMIELGPDGGSEGGRIVATGRPAKIAAKREAPTAVHLADYCERLGRMLPTSPEDDPDYDPNEAWLRDQVFGLYD